MRRKNLGLKVAALAVTGTIAVSPMTVRAEEGTASTAVLAPASAAAGATSSAGTTATSGAATTTVAPATSGTTTTAPAVTGAASASAASTTTATATAPAAGATATTSATTATTTATTPAAPVTVSEPAADPATTAPNDVNTNVSDGMQGTKMDAGFFLNAEIKPEDTKNDKKFGVWPLSDTKNKDLVLNGDLSVSKDGNAYNSTETAPFDANSGESYTLKADLDVSAVTKAIKGAEEVQFNGGDAYVDKLETGLRSTFTMDNNLDGSFYIPTDLEDAKQHYELSSADSNPMIYRINYGNSSFSNKKVSIAMDLDLTKMTPLKNQYTGDKVGLEHLYGAGTGNRIENFNPSSWHYNTSVLGNLRELVTRSAQKIQLVMKGVKLDSATGNRVETETTTATTTETTTDKTITTEGSLQGTLVGYMKAVVGKSWKQKVAFKWGAIQNDAGRDKVAGQGNDKVYLTVKFTDKERTVTPIAPVNPVQPVNPGNGGNGGNGGSRTPIVNPSTPSQPGNVLGEDRPTPSNQGEVLGENRPTPATVENTVAVAKKGEVLGENRPVAKNLSTRGKVSTGDYNFAGLWASLFGLSVLSLAGYVVLSKRAEEK